MRDFRDMNPFVILLYYIFCVTLPIVTLNPLIISATLISAVCYYLIISPKRKPIALWITVFVLTTVINPLFVHRGNTVLFVLNDYPITFEALMYGVITGCAVVSGMILLVSFSEVMSSDRLIYIFGMLSPTSSVIFQMSFRQIKILSAKRKEIENAKTVMGEFVCDDFIGRIRSKIKVYSALISWALENGIVTAESMEGRGFGKGQRTFYKQFSFTFTDFIFLILFVGSSVISIFSYLFGGISLEFYPSITGMSNNILTVTSYVCYFIFAFIPILISIDENLKWKSLMRKI